MARNLSTGSKSAAVNTNTNWKAHSFLNLYLPTSSGGTKKFGAVALKINSDNEALVKWLDEDPSRAQKLLSKFSVTYQQADVPGNDMVLPE